MDQRTNEQKKPEEKSPLFPFPARKKEMRRRSAGQN